MLFFLELPVRNMHREHIFLKRGQPLIKFIYNFFEPLPNLSTFCDVFLKALKPFFFLEQRCMSVNNLKVYRALTCANFLAIESALFVSLAICKNQAEIKVGRTKKPVADFLGHKAVKFSRKSWICHANLHFSRLIQHSQCFSKLS